MLSLVSEIFLKISQSCGTRHCFKLVLNYISWSYQEHLWIQAVAVLCFKVKYIKFQIWVIINKRIFLLSDLFLPNPPFLVFKNQLIKDFHIMRRSHCSSLKAQPSAVYWELLTLNPSSPLLQKRTQPGQHSAASFPLSFRIWLLWGRDPSTYSMRKYKGKTQIKQMLICMQKRILCS